MAANTSGGRARKFLTRILAAGALLAIYAVGTLAVTGGLLTATTTTAQAQRGWRGGGWRGGGWRGGYRGWGVRGGFYPSYVGRRWVCRHAYWSSGRRCFWI